MELTDICKQIKTYLKPGDTPPKGESTQVGPKGGKYYVSGVQIKPVAPESRLTHPQQSLNAQKLLDSALKTGELPSQAFSGEIMNKLRGEKVIRRHSAGYGWVVDKPWRLKEIVTSKIKESISPKMNLLDICKQIVKEMTRVTPSTYRHVGIKERPSPLPKSKIRSVFSKRPPKTQWGPKEK